MADRTSVQTGVTCPHLGSYMVEFFGTSVRTGIAHKVILTSQFVRTGIVPQLGYARVLDTIALFVLLCPTPQRPHRAKDPSGTKTTTKTTHFGCASNSSQNVVQNQSPQSPMKQHLHPIAQSHPLCLQPGPYIVYMCPQEHIIRS